MRPDKSQWSLHFTSFLLLEAMAWSLRPALGNEESSSSIYDAPSVDHAQQYVAPKVDPSRMHFAEHFDDLFEKDNIEKRWIKSKASKEDTAEDVAKYVGEWKIEQPIRAILSGDYGLVLKSKAKHAAIASPLLSNRPFVFKDKPLILQYEVTLQEGQECGGSYIKLLSDGDNTKDLKQFNDKTPYTIMFGPDKCGNDVKLHFIFRHVNPINGSITEKHCSKQKDRLDGLFKDRRPHLYQLIIRPDNTYTIRIDHKIINEGTLLTNFTPPVNPPAEIDDPNDQKPENWDDREMIPDPEAKKPQDWDENEQPQIPDPKATKPLDWLDDLEEMIPDDTAIKPSDWDNDMDGEWEAPLIPNPLCEKAVGCGLWKAPMISNPNYKGKWRPPLIANVNYQGKWTPRKIINPDYFEDLNPFRMTAIVAVGIEIWSMSNEILFDNIVITDDESVAKQWALQTFDLKLKILDRQAQTLWDRALRYMNYKPAYWGAYFVYCSIPMLAYVWFLWTRRDKKSDAKTVSGLMKKTDDYTAIYDQNANTGLDGERSKKNDLNANANQHHEINAEEEGDGTDDVRELQEKNSGEDELLDPEKWNDEVIDMKNGAVEEGLKKRKPRKD
ncbi:calnexin-like isoform X1 [Anopheles albimanus]|uniref:calnexin-like isoform X1 n=2 Tax=Anopheles albimanus TaxID=7167 RepID=UPI001642107C|nr:calnexin-like isoform X1 [Anopheles albimanus]XP_035793730.1 calnexin-like isoform X1 [Anopheles albimanus]